MNKFPKKRLAPLIAAAVAIFLIRDHLYLRAGMAHMDSGATLPVYTCLSGKDLMVVDDACTYKYRDTTVRRCNRQLVHGGGLLMLENLNTNGGGLPLDGNKIKANGFDAQPRVSEGHLSFRVPSGRLTF